MSNNAVFCTVYKNFLVVETWVDLLISLVLKCACGGDTFSKEVLGVDKLVILQLCKCHPYGRIGQLLIIVRVSLERVSYKFGYPVKLLFSGKGAKNEYIKYFFQIGVDPLLLKLSELKTRQCRPR